MFAQSRPTALALGAILLCPWFSSPAAAQVAGQAQADTVPYIEIAVREGTVGSIARFTSATKLGNSVLFQNGTTIGLGTTEPTSKLEISANNALTLRGKQPYMTFRDTGAGGLRHVVRSDNGGLSLLGADYFRNNDPTAMVRIDRSGRVGFGTANPLRALQIGPSTNATFTIEPSDQSPRAGFIRFGDNTGWKLHFGRSREVSQGPLNTGITGTLMELTDNGTFRLVGFPSGPTGTSPLCRTLSNIVTICQAGASSLRYKSDLEPYRRGLEIIELLEPVSFTRKLTGTRDFGLVAEDVEKVEPLLTYPDDSGAVDGIHYELLTVVLVNAVKEQEAEIARQHARIGDLEARLARLEAATR